MKKLKFSIFFISYLLFVGIVFAQDQVNSQREKLNIVQIKEKAKVDAKNDFNRKSKLRWGGSSLVTFIGIAVLGEVMADQLDEVLPILSISAILVPSSAAVLKNVVLPEHRKKEILTKSNKYQSLYLSKYKSTLKIQRIKYTLLGPIAFFGSFLLIGIAFILSGAGA